MKPDEESKESFGNKLIVERKSPKHESIEFFTIKEMLHSLYEFNPVSIIRGYRRILGIEELHHHLDNIRHTQLHLLLEEDSGLGILPRELLELR